MNLSFILEGFDHVLAEVLTAVSPVLVLFLIFSLVFKMPKSALLALIKGVVFAFTGLALFLQGVKVGFLPVGMEMGSILGGMPNRWILIPLGFVLGFVATLAEPAVRILGSQVEKSSSGYIRKNIIMVTLCLAVGLFIALGMTRVVYGIPFYYIIIPGYLAATILMIFSKPSFTSIAFDSGGVATGPMTVTFIMALAVGAADKIEGRDAIIDGFGLVALVALAPIIMVMLLGFLYPDQEADDDDITEDEQPPSEEIENDQADSRAEPELADPDFSKNADGREEVKPIILDINDENANDNNSGEEVNNNDGQDKT